MNDPVSRVGPDHVGDLWRDRSVAPDRDVDSAAESVPASMDTTGAGLVRDGLVGDAPDRSTAPRAGGGGPGGPAKSWGGAKAQPPGSGRALTEPATDRPRLAAIPRSDTTIDEIKGWIGDVNNDGDATVAPAGARLLNCGPATLVVFDRLSRIPSFARAHMGELAPEDLGVATGLPLVAATRDGIAEHLKAEGPGAHTVVEISYHQGQQHSFNAYFDGKDVYALDGQHGTTKVWPPDLDRIGNPVREWFMGVASPQQSRLVSQVVPEGVLHGLPTDPAPDTRHAGSPTAHTIEPGRAAGFLDEQGNPVIPATIGDVAAGVSESEGSASAKSTVANPGTGEHTGPRPSTVPSGAKGSTKLGHDAELASVAKAHSAGESGHNESSRHEQSENAPGERPTNAASAEPEVGGQRQAPENDRPQAGGGVPDVPPVGVDLDHEYGPLVEAKRVKPEETDADGLAPPGQTPRVLPSDRDGRWHYAVDDEDNVRIGLGGDAASAEPGVGGLRQAPENDRPQAGGGAPQHADDDDRGSENWPQAGSDAFSDGEEVHAVDSQHGSVARWPPNLDQPENPVLQWFMGTPGDGDRATLMDPGADYGRGAPNGAHAEQQPSARPSDHGLAELPANESDADKDARPSTASEPTPRQSEVPAEPATEASSGKASVSVKPAASQQELDTDKHLVVSSVEASVLLL